MRLPRRCRLVMILVFLWRLNLLIVLKFIRYWFIVVRGRVGSGRLRMCGQLTTLVMRRDCRILRRVARCRRRFCTGSLA